jgi:AcrR family transcriptional regulator
MIVSRRLIQPRWKPGEPYLSVKSLRNPVRYAADVTAETTGRIGNKPGPKPRLSREQIVDAAVELGVEHLSIAAVAAALGVAQGSLYRYVDGVDDLARAAVEQVFARTPLPSADDGWRALLEGEARIRWDLLQRYSGLVRDNGADLTAVGVARFTALVRALQTAGFALGAAVHLVDTVIDLVHDGATQVVALRADDGGLSEAASAILTRYPEDIAAEVAAVMADPWPHVARKITLVLDGVTPPAPGAGERG